MNIEEFRNYCISKKGVTESFPFDEKTLVFKVMGKMFALIGLDNNPATANLKCDPERSVELREQYPDQIYPGYHMDKKHWNTVEIEGNFAAKTNCGTDRPFLRFGSKRPYQKTSN